MRRPLASGKPLPEPKYIDLTDPKNWHKYRTPYQGKDETIWRSSWTDIGYFKICHLAGTVHIEVYIERYPSYTSTTSFISIQGILNDALLSHIHKHCAQYLKRHLGIATDLVDDIHFIKSGFIIERYLPQRTAAQVWNRLCARHYLDWEHKQGKQPCLTKAKEIREGSLCRT